MVEEKEIRKEKGKGNSDCTLKYLHSPDPLARFREKVPGKNKERKGEEKRKEGRKRDGEGRETRSNGSKGGDAPAYCNLRQTIA